MEEFYLQEIKNPVPINRETGLKIFFEKGIEEYYSLSLSLSTAARVSEACLFSLIVKNNETKFIFPAQLIFMAYWK